MPSLPVVSAHEAAMGLSRTGLLLACCSVGLSCHLLSGALLEAHAQASTGPTLLAQAPREKASPFATAKDETSEAASPAPAPLEELNGRAADGSKKNSPFASAKESDGEAERHLQADPGRLWWLLLPIGLAAISYGGLRRAEGEN